MAEGPGVTKIAKLLYTQRRLLPRQGAPRADSEAHAGALSPPYVAPGREWHACSLQTALGAIGQAIDNEKALP